MKILFISSADQPDYQCDCVYHGLKTLMGKDLESVSDMWYMYDTLTPGDRKNLYGKGFTLYGLLKSELKNVPHYTKIVSNIQGRHYDFIIYGSIVKDKTLLDLVIANYTSNEIAFIDGEDIHYIEDDLVTKGVYFKRELVKKSDLLHPISFGIPREKIIDYIPAKTREWSINYPGKLSTYIHQTEESYYGDYQQSKYAVTFKKEGWDCLRHYEIIANGCLPYFTDIENCPPDTMVNFPKEIVSAIAQKIATHQVISNEAYKSYLDQLTKHFVAFLTTEKVAQSILDVLKSKKTLAGNKAMVTDVQKASWAYKINKLLQIKPANDSGVLIYSGVASIQDVRFIQDNYATVFVHDAFQSAVYPQNSGFENSKLAYHAVDSIDAVNKIADTIILDFTLPYIDDVTGYLIKVKGLMDQKTSVIVIVPNFYNLASVIAFKKQDFRFGRLKLSKKPPVNFYSAKSIQKLLKAFDFQVDEIEGYEFDNTHFIKRAFNKIKSLKFFTCKMLIVKARLNHA